MKNLTIQELEFLKRIARDDFHKQEDDNQLDRSKCLTWISILEKLGEKEIVEEFQSAYNLHFIK